MHRQKQQTPQRQQRKPMPTPSAAGNGDADGATATTLTTRGKVSSAASITVQCPQCCHSFRLLDCLLAAAAAETSGHEPVTTSLSPQDFRQNSGDCWQQHQEQHQIQRKTPSQMDIDLQKDLTGNSISLSSSPGDATAAAAAYDTSLPSNALHTSNTNLHILSTPALSNRTPSCQSMRPLRTSEDQDQLTSEVVRNFQIVNTTIEQLEDTIMDKSDRRIRKISAISGCNIDLRSEVPAGRFGVAKNFCVIRSRSEANIDSCRGMLAKQMDWKLVVKPN